MISKEAFLTLVNIFKIKHPDSKIEIKEIDQESFSKIKLSINGIEYKLANIDSKVNFNQYVYSVFEFSSENVLYPRYFFKIENVDNENFDAQCNANVYFSEGAFISLGWDAYGNYFDNADIVHMLINIHKVMMSNYTYSSINDDVIKYIESKGWTVVAYEDGLELQQYSPEGQDFVVKLEGKSIEEWIVEAQEGYENYDPSTEAMLWVDNEGHGINGAPHDLINLINDLIWCKGQLKKLHTDLSNYKPKAKKQPKKDKKQQAKED